jgi:3-keto-L-gulonate-6-phosphate decarboxylase
MMWPFAKKEEKKKDAKAQTKRPKELDSTDLEAKRALKRSADACTMSGILDDEAMQKLQEARKRTDTMRRKVKANKDHISDVLTGDKNETVQERALRELEEQEAREERERAGA